MQGCYQNLESYYITFDADSDSCNEEAMPISPYPESQVPSPQPSCSMLQSAHSARVGRPAVPDETRDKTIADARSKGDHKTLKREKNNKSSAVYRNKKKAKATKVEMEEEEEKHKNGRLRRRARKNKKNIKLLKAQLRELFQPTI